MRQPNAWGAPAPVVRGRPLVLGLLGLVLAGHYPPERPAVESQTQPQGRPQPGSRPQPQAQPEPTAQPEGQWTAAIDDPFQLPPQSRPAPEQSPFSEEPAPGSSAPSTPVLLEGALSGGNG